MQALSQDLRFGLRLMAKNPGFVIVAVLTLALGIGANTAIFSIVQAVLLRPLPFPEASRLIYLEERGRALNTMSIAWPNLQDWRAQNQVFKEIGVYRRQSFNLAGDEQAERILSGVVTADFFSALGVQPTLGRFFSREDDRPGASPTVILSHALWQSRFGGRAEIVNQTVRLSDVNYTVVGIMPPSFRFPSRVEMWVPLGLSINDPVWADRSNHNGLLGITRLKDGVTIDAARAEMDRIAIGLERQYPASNAGSRVTLKPLLETFIGDVRPRLLVLFGAVGLVLLIACANVASLLLVRALAREKEIAVRAALGASRSRIARQLLIESLILSLAAGGIGSLIAAWGVDLILAVSPGNIPRADGIAIDLSVLGFTLAISVIAGLAFGLAPAWSASRIELVRTLKEAARGGGGRGNRFRSAMVVVEVALTVVLLVAAGLLVRSFAALGRVELGFEPERVLALDVSLSGLKYSTIEKKQAFYDELFARLRALPGVEAVGIASGLPIGQNGWQQGYTIDGEPPLQPGQQQLAEVTFTSGDYLRAMGIGLKRGRAFEARDQAAETPEVILIDEEFARRHWPGRDPLGARVHTGWGDMTVIGVVGRVRMDGVQEELGHSQIYYPYRRIPLDIMTVVMRAKGEPLDLANSARRAVADVDRNQPVFNVQTLEMIRRDELAAERFNLTMIGIFAALAFGLALLGLYSLISSTVAQRTHEIGIRIALGAQKSDVLRLIIGRGMTLVGAGITVGLIAALALAQVLAGLLFGVSPYDPLTFGAVALLLAMVALLACYLPAHRAAKVEPIRALRYE